MSTIITTTKQTITFPKVFVTVGTTKFDNLINHICEPNFLTLLHDKLGTTHIIIQYGNTSIQTLKAFQKAKEMANTLGIIIDGYSLKAEGINDDIENADLVISHAGAGSIMETLSISRKRGKDKPVLCVVCNSLLMDNHQHELANAMRPYALVADSPDELDNTITNLIHTLPNIKIYNKPDGMQRLVDLIYNMFP